MRKRTPTETLVFQRLLIRDFLKHKTVTVRGADPVRVGLLLRECRKYARKLGYEPLRMTVDSFGRLLPKTLSRKSVMFKEGARKAVLNRELKR